MPTQLIKLEHKYFKEKLDRKNVTPTRFLDSCERSEELFLSVGKGYLMTGLLKFFGMTTLDDLPTANLFLKELRGKTNEEKKIFD